MSGKHHRDRKPDDLAAQRERDARLQGAIKRQMNRRRAEAERRSDGREVTQNIHLTPEVLAHLPIDKGDSRG